MPRQILHLAATAARTGGRAIACRSRPTADRLLRQRVAGIDELEVVHHLREPIDLRRLEAERLPHLARRAAAAIGDDVGGHRRAEPAVFLVDVLDDPLAPIAARQIEIDVGPLAALLRQKPLEQQIHPDRIDRRDPEAVADGAVGRRPAPLHEDVVLPAEIDDVPDDEEVAGEIELLDEIELARDLRARAVVIRPVALARADVGDLPQERRLRLAGRHRIVGKAVAEIGHRVLQAIGQRAGARHRVRHDRANSAAISAGGFRYRSAFGASRRPARARLVWWWMQVSTSNSGRSAGVGEADAVGRERSARETRPPGRRAPRCRAPRRGGSAAAARRRRWSRPNMPTRRSSRPPTPCRRAVERRAAGERDEAGACSRRAPRASARPRLSARAASCA